ncbi:hypothetical protein Hamer_G012562 [Homarus americanus]|uniref:Uncharacterized protein n=1 Tax=Homarus americanus TaxID=6706 RepID=A0A8J5KEX1_HOMAM|nr:hypothetical protein Hamer_G012562 [Homarus americanus]
MVAVESFAADGSFKYCQFTFIMGVTNEEQTFHLQNIPLSLVGTHNGKQALFQAFTNLLEEICDEVQTPSSSDIQYSLSLE